MKIPAQKYTLSLPTAIYEELSKEAERQDRSIKEVVRWCLEFGMIGMKIREDPNAELILREKVEIQGSGKPPKYEIKETILKLV